MSDFPEGFFEDQFEATCDEDTILQAAAREAGWALSTLVDEIKFEKRQHVVNIINRLSAALYAIPSPSKDLQHTEGDPIGYVSEYGLQKLASKAHHYCLSVNKSPENEFQHPIFSSPVKVEGPSVKPLVKPLEWVETHPRHWEASDLLYYRIEGVTANENFRLYCDGHEMKPATGYYWPLDDAKAAAQSHFDTAIRSTLVEPVTDETAERGETVSTEREFLAQEARRYASHYPEASDGRNTFIIFAEMIERRASPPSQYPVMKKGE